jgi:hypothetical protein
LSNSYSAWQVGPNASEPLSANDIIVKYTYTGDLTLAGSVTFTDSLTFNGNYPYYQSGGAEWANGDTNGDGAVTFIDSLTFNGVYNNGTVNASSQSDSYTL